MRMQNAEMEFVTFDAQDVIATSGPFYGQKLAATMNSLDAYNDVIDAQGSGTKFANKSGGWAVTDEDPTGKYYKTGTWLTYNYDLTSGDAGWKSENTSSNTAPKDTSATGYFLVNDVNNAFNLISEWLAKQNINS